ncbi:RagB/SusD family nutrient uptake outer membrane protein [Chitinophaga pinensis]|uniref:RagB/SusD family nutrient uptake outer membrane protein n=1 Tax=Chitinophaga pinensis TaxID=79329 RepID=A0A5C6LJN1_9BACT|nr:RagB/SusD family nutrient uptake outer membrane protein [Chitinophaga pinensis]TWV89188.1 RagB/SusD family nutrient uptake outer membrane protein [Chitinophaga pinensis]
MQKFIILSLIIVSILMQTACEKALDVTPPGEFAPGNVLTTEKGIRSVLFSSYAGIQNPTPTRYLINNAEVTTDIGYNTGGAENLTLVQLINFTWDASLGTLQADVWAPTYRTIRDANIVLENIGNVNTPEASRKGYAAEARFLRAYAYYLLYIWFGPVPLRISTTSEAVMARATDEQMKSFIETELAAAITDLPDPGKEEAFARANKGAAWSVLAKFYLNTRQWQKAADACQQVVNFGYYQLFPTYQNLFTVENEGNKEMIMVHPCRNQDGFGNWYSAGALPPGFKTSAQIPAYVWTASMANFATQYRMRSAFTNTFDTINDQRSILLLRHYVNTSNAWVNLLSTPDNVRSLKYWDNATVGNHSGNDVPIIRYADILLSRAEALNEVNGPTQEALDLINQVRKRAGIANLTLTDATGKDVLRDLILRERAWEFYSEGLRREDLLRHDKFISLAKARGITVAADKHKLFPIPQAEIDANPACKQNPDY